MLYYYFILKWKLSPVLDYETSEYILCGASFQNYDPNGELTHKTISHLSSNWISHDDISENASLKFWAGGTSILFIYIISDFKSNWSNSRNSSLCLVCCRPCQSCAGQQFMKDKIKHLIYASWNNSTNRKIQTAPRVLLDLYIQQPQGTDLLPPVPDRQPRDGITIQKKNNC